MSSESQISDPSWKVEQPRAFAQALGRFPAGPPVAVLAHDDADGLSSAALLARGLARAGREARIRLIGRGESAWSEPVAAWIRGLRPAGVVVADLGVRSEPVASGLPAILVDHHVPQGLPDGATVVSGYGQEPTPSTSLLAYRGLQAVAGIDDLLWLAALGLIGDYGEKAPFDELQAARKSYGAKVLREAVSLINAPRRSSTGEAAPALRLLLKANGPEEIASGQHSETERLRADRDEVKAALDQARRIPPRFAGEVALIELRSPCQIHPLVAQSWTGRLRRQIVIAANAGFREGYVHFAARSATGRNLVAFLRERVPQGMGPDESFGQGHEGASGGVVRPGTWERFLAGLGFRPGDRAPPAPGASRARP